MSSQPLSQADVPLFRGLSPAELQALGALAEEQRVARGQWVLREGDPGDALFVVLEGALEVTKQDALGIQTPVAMLAAGQVVGEMSLLDAGRVRSASAMASTDVRLLCLDGPRFRELLARGDVGALKVVANLARVMSQRLLAVTERLVDNLAQAGETAPRTRDDLKDLQGVLQRWSF